MWTLGSIPSSLPTCEWNEFGCLHSCFCVGVYSIVHRPQIRNLPFHEALAKQRRAVAMATTAAFLGVSHATLLQLPRLAKGFSSIAGLNGFPSVRSCGAASCSTSHGVGFYLPMIGKAPEPTGRETGNFWHPKKPEKDIALAAKSARRLVTRTAASRQQYNVPQQQPETVPLWLWICLASYRTVTDALQFLWEQPGQLKDIEWPSLQSTIRMAMLTVVVVALLIIFLATIDSTFSYALSSILRRVP